MKKNKLGITAFFLITFSLVTVMSASAGGKTPKMAGGNGWNLKLSGNDEGGGPPADAGRAYPSVFDFAASLPPYPLVRSIDKETMAGNLPTSTTLLAQAAVNGPKEVVLEGGGVISPWS